MIKEIYAIKDNLVGFWDPYLMDNESVAHRDFVAMLQSGNARIISIAKDLDLYRLGTIDIKTGKITPVDEPEFIARGSIYVPSEHLNFDPNSVIDAFLSVGEDDEEGDKTDV